MKTFDRYMDIAVQKELIHLDNYRLMLVDDEPWALAGMEEIIDWEQEGFSVVARCECGSEAIAKSARVCPDAVITDIRMPDMTGIELVYRLRQNFPNVQCVVVSAYSDFEVAREAIRLSAVHYLLKPLTASDVREAARMLAQKLSRFERTSEPSTPVISVDPDHPVFPESPNGLECYLVLSESAFRLSPREDGRWCQPVQVGGQFGYLLDDYPDSLPEGCGLSLPGFPDRQGEWLLRTARAALAGGFTFARENGRGQLSVPEIQLYLVENMRNEITLKELAAHFFVTEIYLCDRFKKQTNESIMSFLRRIRMHHAQVLLMTSHLSLREVAFACGYSDYSYFGRQFKAEVGITPDLFRKEKRYTAY